jgi:hypothetical protein
MHVGVEYECVVDEAAFDEGGNCNDMVALNAESTAAGVLGVVCTASGTKGAFEWGQERELGGKDRTAHLPQGALDKQVAPGEADRAPAFVLDGSMHKAVNEIGQVHELGERAANVRRSDVVEAEAHWSTLELAEGLCEVGHREAMALWQAHERIIVGVHKRETIGRQGRESAEQSGSSRESSARTAKRHWIPR